MTTLAAWVAVDVHGPTAIYLCTDSRISWGTVGQANFNVWDFSPKVFICQNSGDMFGYAGSSLAVTKILTQLISTADSGALFSNESAPDERVRIVSEYLKKAITSFPAENLGKHKSIILHCSQNLIGKPKPSEFILSSLCFDKSFNFRVETHQIPQYSELVGSWGTGVSNLKNQNGRWKNSDIGRTSRAVFGAVYEAITNGVDPYTGGAPQLVGMYRYQRPKIFGIIHNNSCYISGSLVPESDSLNSVEWRNKLFEICDWRTKDKKIGAQKHAKPRNI